MAMSEGYRVAQNQNQSYAHQNAHISVPISKSEITEIPFGGSQPLGVTAKDEEVVIASYFEPALCHVKVTTFPESMTLAVGWIRGVLHEGQSIRLFPDIEDSGGANRAQTVNLERSGIIWVSRNRGHEFFVLEKEQDRWHLVSRIELPPATAGDMIHSALVDPHFIFTVESGPNFLEPWRLCTYERGPGRIRPPFTEVLSPWTYGIARRGSYLWLVADWRNPRAGIFRRLLFGGGLELVVPGVRGTGICFLEDGSALVSRYGQSAPGSFNGEGGALIYIPAVLLP